MAQTGQSDAIHSPEAWARTVLSRTMPAVSWIEVVWTVAISCWLKVFRTMSSPLDSGAYRKDRSAAVAPSERMVPINDFSGFTSCAWALASAAAIVPIVSLDRCTAALRFKEVEADCAGFGAFGPHPMANRSFGILRHQRLELCLRALMVQKSLPGAAEEICKFRPGIRCAHVHNSDRF